MTAYPRVLDEMETLRLVAKGRSIARFGDGEFALVEGMSILMQAGDVTLSARLRTILRGEQLGASCMVGIPNLRAKLPQKKAHFWEKYHRCAALLTPGYPYVSSFITRPDNAPWLDEPTYWARLESLWKGKDVVLVRGDDPRGTAAVSLLPQDLASARSVRDVVAPGVQAWADYPRILEAIGTPTTAILCLGPTATVLAVDLCARGVHAIDLGHVGMFLHWRQKGKSVTKPRSSRERRRVPVAV